MISGDRQLLIEDHYQLVTLYIQLKLIENNFQLKKQVVPSFYIGITN